MKEMIEREVLRKGLDNNIKLVRAAYGKLNLSSGLSVSAGWTGANFCVNAVY